MILKVVSARRIVNENLKEGIPDEIYEDVKYYEGKRISKNQLGSPNKPESGVLIGIEDDKSDYWVELRYPITSDDEAHEIYIMENGKTIDHFSVS